MLCRMSLAAIAFAALCVPCTVAQAHDETIYPDWNGQWRRPPGVGNQWDTSKPPRKGEAPLTAEYQAIYEANLKDQAEGGQGTDPTFTCIPDGMPRAMNVIFPMEIIILPKTTYMLIEYLSMLRRVFTDGRDWPVNIEPTFAGYSIGRWIDEDGDGIYDVLEVETRGFKGPRAVDETGLPMHEDNQTIFKERIYRDKADPKILHDEMTMIDNALTRPWTVDKKYVLNPDPRPNWPEYYTNETNGQIKIGKENYFLSWDGHLMPTKKGQAPPDLQYFKQGTK